MIKRETVVHVAELAALSLTEAEVDELARDLAAIVAYVEQLDHVDTEGVSPAMSGMGVSQAGFRSDEPQPGLSHEDALASAPRTEGGGFAVPPFVTRERTPS
jgi:aspartyl-tRNA(Asn)/glutamyl-tRNA(Gln) amidotransferase subunit C